MAAGKKSLWKFVVNSPKLNSLIVLRYCKDGVISEPSFNKLYRVMNATIDYRRSVPLKAMNLPDYRRKRVLQSAAALAKLVCNAQSLEQFISANPEECRDLGMSKECLLGRLEVARIEVAIGCPNEFELLEFLLKNAAALDSVTIVGKSSNGENEWISFKEKVMEIP
ncbi:hypothetical protein Scep_013296 [Stephania cephalantha]|uniref:FBD domain-containing protein n=1 Tax=Stephania cephalantha TaxID=152367 RepID=A0AAP0JGT6_9MAGN